MRPGAQVIVPPQVLESRQSEFGQICGDYRRVRDDLHAATMDALTNSGLLEEILRPASLAQQAA